MLNATRCILNLRRLQNYGSRGQLWAYLDGITRTILDLLNYSSLASSFLKYISLAFSCLAYMLLASSF